METELRCYSINDFIEIIKIIRQLCSKKLFFRGQSSCTYSLIPSLARSSKNDKQDGEVFIFENKYDSIEANSPLRYAIADSYRLLTRSNSAKYNLENFFELAIEQPYFLEQKYLKRYFENIGKNGGEWIYQECQKLFIINSPLHSQRQRNQLGRYILFNNAVEKQEVPCFCCHKKPTYIFKNEINEIKKDSKDIVGRIIIDANAKEQILSDLDLCGINSSFIYPDNIDLICKNIKESIINKL